MSKKRKRKLFIICDNCKRNIAAFALTQDRIGGGLIKVILSCPDCGFIASQFFTNPELDKARESLKTLRAGAGKNPENWQRWKVEQVKFQRLYDRVQAVGEKGG